MTESEYDTLTDICNRVNSEDRETQKLMVGQAISILEKNKVTPESVETLTRDPQGKFFLGAVYHAFLMARDRLEREDNE